MAFFWVPGCSSWFPGVLGAEVDNARDVSWRRCFTAWLFLAAEPTHVGVDVDWLAYQALSCPITAVCSDASRGMRCPWAWIFVEY
jgi:hypothetical protein